ncbi:MAG: T9SS type A sorting domain-containing protein, partial [Bacteroidetes bacterium]|nr:T9SS type A sorting domain-containing protein [Bacteroidota bacterium]
ILTANVTIPATAFTGDYTVYMNNPIDGHLELVNSFHVNGLKSPLLVSISPNKASAGHTLDVTITGSNTHFGQGSPTASVSFEGGISVNFQSILNDSSISANITIPHNIYPRGYSVSVFDSVDGNMSLLNSFYIDSAGYNSCYSHFTTNYDSINNKFTLVIDSITSAKAISFNWDFGDGNSSTDATPVHTFLADAIYNVCLKIITASGDTCSYCHPIGKDSLGNVYRQSGFSMSVVRYNGTTVGISENTSITSIDVYPNPANSFVTIVTNQKITDEKPIISLYNMKGELILQQNLVQNKTELDINGFANGIYLVHVTSNGKSDAIKFIKQ